MRRYVRLLGAFWSNSLRQAVEFKANFWANLFTNLGWMASLLALVAIIFRNTHSVAGWTESEMFVLYGTYSLMRGLSDTVFYTNLSQMPTYVRKGDMDFILTKPVNSQFYVSLRYIRLDELGQSVGSLGIIALALLSGHQAFPPPANIAFYFALVLLSVVLFYSLNMLLMTLSFWLVRLDNLMVLADTVYSAARTPIDVWGVFGPLPKIVLTYVLPLAFLAAIPTKALFGTAGWPLVLEASGLVAFFFICSILFWRVATRSYSSASS